MYADDTTLNFNLEEFPLPDREGSINNELDKVNTWLKLNKLTLNTDKTKCMLFHKRRKVNPLQLSINDQQISQVDQFTFLGVLLDDTLSWKNHINMVTNKLSKIIGILHRLKHYYPDNILLTIYNSLFVPHLNYGSLAWGSVSDRLETIQKKAVRIITHSNYIAHTEPIFKYLGLLKVKDLFAFKLLKFLHKLSHNELPPYFDVYRPYLEKIITPYNLRPHPLPIPLVAHKYAESGLVYQLVSMKNQISENDELVMRKLEERSHSHAGFCSYVKLTMLEKYQYLCVLRVCRTCGRS